MIGIDQITTRNNLLRVTLLSTLIASIISIAEGLIDFEYTFLIIMMTIFGTLPGIYI